ncbi:hypothetical protein [Streptomyces antibioticus]|uniref:hypothetical protein n=1 Tax=Streptomyces antibioticus TaxID=1890 RepID=UPI002250217B|nr:hypothetical protein [Streptomyces antibioticus]MCX4743866.1 hypothetical protein [Streptomyces antibioticus]
MPSDEQNTPEQSGSVSIGSMSGGSIATGSHGTATSYNTTGAEPDPRHAELLAAIRELREALPSAADRSEVDAALDGELADAEAEIVGAGTAGTARLTRLLDGVRGWLGSQAAAVGAVASATAVVQGIAQLLA